MNVCFKDKYIWNNFKTLKISISIIFRGKMIQIKYTLYKQNYRNLFLKHPVNMWGIIWANDSHLVCLYRMIGQIEDREDWLKRR